MKRGIIIIKKCDKKADIEWFCCSSAPDWNGPEIGECDEILKNALDLHFKNKRFGVHFKTNNLFNTAGPTVTNVLKRKNKFNIY